jgi:hypothetical protein
MAINANQRTIQLEASDAFWGTKQCRSWETVADSSGSLDGTYFDLNIIDNQFNEVLGYVYFNTDPAISGKTGYLASIAVDATADEVAQAIETALASENVKVSVSANKVIIENKVLGKITAETDSGSTGFTQEVLIEALGGYLGKTAQGGVEISLETQTIEIKSDQTGEITLDDIAIGNAVSAEVGLLELSEERLQAIIGGVAGDNHTPSGGTTLTGFGESRLYQSLASIGGQLILHPIRLEDTDKSRDVSFHKSAPLPQSINYSGQDPQVLQVTFKPYLDESVNESINLFSIGDWTQDLA